MPITHDRPSDVVAERGDVHIDGPGGVAVSLTHEAAAETSNRLARGAAMAVRQRTRDRSIGAGNPKLGTV